MTKYRAKKTTREGTTFDSQKEYRRFCELRLLEKAGKISDLQLQVKFELIPAQYETIPTGKKYTRGERKGQPKTKRICVEKSVAYYADFVYTEDGKQIVEDAKGVRTKDYIIKRKLMLYIHGIKIKET